MAERCSLSRPFSLWCIGFGIACKFQEPTRGFKQFLSNKLSGLNHSKINEDGARKLVDSVSRDSTSHVINSIRKWSVLITSSLLTEQKRETLDVPYSANPPEEREMERLFKPVSQRF